MVENNRYLVTAFDESFSVMGAALIKSIWKNCSNSINIFIIVLDTGIEEKTRFKFAEWAAKEKKILQFICNS
jgi:hypothetical protein